MHRTNRITHNSIYSFELQNQTIWQEIDEEKNQMEIIEYFDF